MSPSPIKRRTWFRSASWLLFAFVVVLSLSNLALAAQVKGPRYQISGRLSATQNPLVASYTVNAPAGSQVYVAYGVAPGPVRLRTSTQVVSQDSVTILVAGMRELTTYLMHAVVLLPNGVLVTESDRRFTTGAIPPALKFYIKVSRPTPTRTPQPGVELLSRAATVSGQAQAVVTDLNGNIIWYYGDRSAISPNTMPIPIKLLPNGHFLVNMAPYYFREIDLAGNTVRQFTPTDLYYQLAAMGIVLPSPLTIHHDFEPLPNGHVILLINWTQTYQNVGGNAGPTDVTVDGLVDLDPNWNPVWFWSAADHLDIYGTDAPRDFPAFDWTHSNDVAYLPDGNLLLSSRALHTLYKIDYENGAGNGDILWRLGYNRDFQLTNGGPQNWFYGQHDAQIVHGGGSVLTISVFDNGNFRRDAQDNPCSGNFPNCYSRGAIYRVDQSAMTATQLWAYQPGYYGPFVGSTQALPNTDVEIDVGAVSGTLNAHVVEVSSGPVPQVVWTMDVGHNDTVLYRTTRLPSLYPGVTVPVNY